jgi:hypothetical protein
MPGDPRDLQPGGVKAGRSSSKAIIGHRFLEFKWTLHC